MKDLIEFIHIEGFQSQYDTRIDFSEGMTALTGLSMDGKTAIMRAFEFVRNNRPSGFKFNYRYEDIPTKVTIGVNGHEIIHMKSDKPLNKEGHKALYIIKHPDGSTKEYSAYGSKVPDEVTELLNISDISMQSQLDPYMLVLSTSGQIAATINKITGIEASEVWMKKIKTTTGNLKAEKIVLEGNQKRLSEEISAVNWIDDFKAMTEKAQELDWKYDRVIRDANAILDLVNVNSATIAKIKAIESQLFGLKDITKGLNQVDDRLADFTTKNALINEYRRNKKSIQDASALFDTILPVIGAFDIASKEIQNIKEKLNYIEFYNNQKLMAETCLEELEREKDNLASLLLDSGKCFVCGNELNDLEKIREGL